jgi:3-keto-disaccharide hydrolase
MVRSVLSSLIAGVLCLLMASTSVCAQDAATNISKAQQTLSAIQSLLVSIQERHTALLQPHDNAKPSAEAGGWKSLFDGASLGNWKRTAFAGAADVHVDPKFRGGPAAIVVAEGDPLNGINWTSETPKTNYEITLEAMKIEGSDFMCGLTFPVGDSYASLILGGWGGTVVGISSIDNLDASENETTRSITFPKDHWFVIRMRVTPTKLEAWLDEKQIVDANIMNKKISLRFGEISKSMPLGLATYQTSSAFRSIKMRRLDEK